MNFPILKLIHFPDAQSGNSVISARILWHVREFPQFIDLQLGTISNS